MLLTRHILLPNVTSIIRLNFYFAYLDNILIFNTSWKEHLQHLEIVFNHLKLAKLKIELSKCQFYKQHLNYLGNLISLTRHSATTRKSLNNKKLKELNSVDELCHFLGFTSYYRRCVPLFADITKPLNKLLIKDTKFQWSA